MEEDVEIALDIVVNEIANVTNKYAVCKDSKKNSIYKAKLEVLEKMQHEIYMNNGWQVNIHIDLSNSNYITDARLVGVPTI